MKELQNRICIELGYSPAPEKGFDMYGKKRQNARADNSKTYHVLKKANVKNQKSYLIDCAEAIKKSLKIAMSKEQFISLMKAQGFETEWKDNKKHIVFKGTRDSLSDFTKSGFSCRVNFADQNYESGKVRKRNFS